MTEIITVAIFALTLIVIFTDKWHRVVVSGLGAAVMVAAGLLLDFYDEERAIEAIEFETLGLLMGMMIMVALLGRTGLFEYIAIRVAQRSRGNLVRLLLMLGLTTSVLSMFLDNVTSIVLITPMIILISELLDMSPLPLLISQPIFSNIGGMATLIGDPPNILIGSASGLTFNDFLTHMGPITLVVWVAGYVVMRYLFRSFLKDTEKQEALENLDADEAFEDRKLARRVLIVLGGIVILFSLESVLNVTPALSALSGAAIALGWTGQDVHEVLEDVEWDVLLFFGALFVMVGGLEAAGVLDRVSEAILSLEELSPRVLGLSIMWAMVVLSALIDNVPITIAVIPVVLRLGAEGIDIHPIWWAVALGAGLGGNATPIGSSANVVVMSFSERTDEPITNRAWLARGIPIAIATTAVASVLYVLLFDYLRAV